MNPFLIKATIRVTPYMNTSKTFDDLRIVMANDENEALAKYNDYYDAKTAEYDVYYAVTEVEVVPPIM